MLKTINLNSYAEATIILRCLKKLELSFFYIIKRLNIPNNNKKEKTVNHSLITDLSLILQIRRKNEEEPMKN